MPHIFLETTIQIQRLLRDAQTLTTLQTTLQTHQAVTSTYVWMEVQRTLGQDYQYLIDLLLNKQPTSLSQWMHYLSVGENLYSPRRLRRILQIMSQICDDLPTTTIEPIAIAFWLKRKRQRMLHHDFFDKMTEVVNSTMCDLIQPDYVIPGNGRMSCRRETARCNLPTLLRTHALSLQQLQENPSALTALEAKTQRALNEANLNFETAKGERNCWSLSDLIITLECPPDALLWTTNLRHFEPLCQVFGRQLFRPDQH